MGSNCLIRMPTTTGRELGAAVRIRGRSCDVSGWNRAARSAGDKFFTRIYERGEVACRTDFADA
jgi:hypothetical protein